MKRKSIRIKTKISKKLLIKAMISIVLAVLLSVATSYWMEELYGKVIALISLIGLLVILMGFKKEE